jgi:hypothetical protein
VVARRAARLSTYDEVAEAALAMADFDAKGGDHLSALEWLAVAEQHRPLTPE